jgi:hypothetical protein
MRNHREIQSVTKTLLARGIRPLGDEALFRSPELLGLPPRGWGRNRVRWLLTPKSYCVKQDFSVV